MKKKNKKIIGLIPCRLNSSRLRQKALLMIDGLPLIVHTFKRAQLCKDLDIAVEECVLIPKDLEKATEVFVTGTAAEVTPVSRINDTVYKVGEVTKKLQEAYTKLTH